MDLSSRLAGQMTELLVTTEMASKHSWFAAREPSRKQGSFPLTDPLPLAARATPGLEFQPLDGDGLSRNVSYF